MRSARSGAFALFALLAFTALPASAQDTIRTPIDTVAVTVTRALHNSATTPAAISLLSRDRIQGAKLTLGLDESLVEVPGVLVSNRNNFAQGPRISVRGFGSRAAFGVRGVRIIQDGIPLTMPDGQATLNNVDLASVGRIEVLRGASSMLYGNASGGVISLRSELPEAGFHSEARVVAGNAAGAMQKYNLKAGGGSELTGFHLSGSFVRADGFRDHSRFEQSNVTGRFVHKRTSASLSWARSPYAEDPGALPYDSAQRYPTAAWPRNVATQAGKIGEQLQVGVQQVARMLGASLEASLYGVNRSLVNPQTFAYIDLQRRAGGARVTMEWPHILLGIDGDLQRDDRMEYSNTTGVPGAQTRDQTDRVTVLAPFARIQMEPLPRVHVVAGARFDHSRFAIDDHFLSDGRDDSNERIMSAFSPSFGVITHGLYANLSTSFQTPTTTEINNSQTPLDPEHALSAEVGARRTFGRVAVDVAAFQIRIRDELIPYQIPSVPGRNFFRNAARTRHRGVELAGRWQASDAVEVSTSYTWSAFHFTDDGAPTAFEGNALPGVPPHHLFARVTARARRVSLEPELEWSSRYWVDDANSRDNPAFFVVNLQGRIPVGSWEFFGAINNLTGRRYNGSVVINGAGGRYYEPAPGTNCYIGIKKILLHNRRNA